MGGQHLQLTYSSGRWIQRIPLLSTSLYNQRRVSVVIQAAFCVFGNYYRCTSNKAARGVSGSRVRHRGDEWANWGLTVNNWRRWDERWAPLCASSCADTSFFLVLLNPATLFVFYLPGFSSSLFSHSVGSPSLFSPLSLQPCFYSLSGWFSSACISCKCRTKWLWQHSQMLQLPQIYWVIKVMYCD